MGFARSCLLVASTAIDRGLSGLKCIFLGLLHAILWCYWRCYWFCCCAGRKSPDTKPPYHDPGPPQGIIGIYQQPEDRHRQTSICAKIVVFFSRLRRYLLCGGDCLSCQWLCPGCYLLCDGDCLSCHWLCSGCSRSRNRDGVGPADTFHANGSNHSHESQYRAAALQRSLTQLEENIMRSPGQAPLGTQNREEQPGVVPVTPGNAPVASAENTDDGHASLKRKINEDWSPSPRTSIRNRPHANARASQSQEEGEQKTRVNLTQLHLYQC